MPLYLTASHSSRIKKPAKRGADTGRRHSSSPFANAPRIKPALQRAKSLADGGIEDLDNEEDGTDRLKPSGKVLSSISVDSAKDVLSAVTHARSSMFASLPERAGMNSVRIAEVLNFQRNMPPVVSLPHVHALIAASSKTEREIAALQATGKLRKIKVTGRGNDVSGLADILITMDGLQALLDRSDVAQDVRTGFYDVLRRHPRATSIPSEELPALHVTALTRSGFLVSSSLTGSRNVSLAGSSLVSMPKISRAASGSTDATGGDSAFENLGGVGAARRSSSSIYQKPSFQANELVLSVPNVGPFLRLLAAGRAHLLELLGKSKYKEAPLYLLRERWDGAVDSDSSVSAAKQIRREFSGVMPAKTKKWKDFVASSKQSQGGGIPIQAASVPHMFTGSYFQGLRKRPISASPRISKWARLCFSNSYDDGHARDRTSPFGIWAGAASTNEWDHPGRGHALRHATTRPPIHRDPSRTGHAYLVRPRRPKKARELLGNIVPPFKLDSCMKASRERPELERLDGAIVGDTTPSVREHLCS
ncbi:hypothetical protein H2200_013076 [Cladophialophora chaetospira]|uniref:Uncharacterized protein n=1 Tax=Cladophialophora chaetospira TaxID=386627 RepID=A0AA38WWN6_9EURO|nr:hypothetical protein H2200_013076 [Cladophialophora chaetospira]